MDAINFQDFLVSPDSQFSIARFLFSFLFTAVSCYLLRKYYIRFGTCLSNRMMFANTFLPLGLTTMLVISVVKSSLALSLGLVGALSIVRFRTAVKEPEELAYLFITISLGLGYGANQTLMTSLAFVAILIAMYFWGRIPVDKQNENMFLNITASKSHTCSLELITEILEKHCDAIVLRRYEVSEAQIEMTFSVLIHNVGSLNTCTSELESLSDSIRIAFLKNLGIEH